LRTIKFFMKKIYTLVLFIITFFIGNAQIVDIPDANFKAKLLSASASNFVTQNLAGNWVAIDTNGDGQIQLSEAQNILALEVDDSDISNLTGIEAFTNLQVLFCYDNQLTSLDVSQNVNLILLDCAFNQLTSLDFSQNVNLGVLYCFSNQLTSLDVSQNVDLQVLSCTNNQLTSLDVSQNVNLLDLSCHYNQLTSLDVTGAVILQQLYCYNNQLTSLDVSQNVYLQHLTCDYNQLTSLDVSQNVILSQLECTYNHLTSLNLKNNYDTNLFFNNNPILQYICADEQDLALMQQLISNYGYTNCHVNSYCSFTPGGTYYEITGITKLDFNNSGCDVNDINYPNLNFSITNGTNTGSFIANTSGNYYIPFQTGTHIVTPVLQNPSYFNISPTTVNVNFPTQASPFTQDFCITPNGIKNDLEIIILPIGVARPGFNAQYKIIYKNKGNQIANGTLTFSFDDSIMDLVSSIPTVDGTGTNTLNWNFTNLNLFETREIDLVFNINSPVETPAVNDGDVLVYTATIAGATDETPNDNTFTLNQTVVNSFDPNDKTCLEGNIISPEMVGEYVHYVIRFENTGTFAAENVVIADVIDTTKFEINTLVPQSSSHDFFTRINGNKVEFIFENINLPFDDENNDGYVAFKIKTKPNLVLGDEFTNTASIYFDYNFPIITNTTSTTVEEPLSNQDFDFETNFTLYPNPAEDVLNIKVKSEMEVKSISIYNTLGQIIMTTIHAENGEINVSNLQSGNYFTKVFTDKGSSTAKFIKQ
jgi:uncharacterized repeat protein (TIGR01451 family)